MRKPVRKNPHAVALGRLGGLVRSEAKQLANRKNGRKGGLAKSRQKTRACRCSARAGPSPPSEIRATSRALSSKAKTASGGSTNESSVIVLVSDVSGAPPPRQRAQFFPIRFNSRQRIGTAKWLLIYSQKTLVIHHRHVETEIVCRSSCIVMRGKRRLASLRLA